MAFISIQPFIVIGNDTPETLINYFPEHNHPYNKGLFLTRASTQYSIDQNKQTFITELKEKS